MNIKSMRSDYIYQKVAQASPEEKLELFRNEMMAPMTRYLSDDRTGAVGDEPLQEEET
ncbi:hypothetical protein [Paenibacillus sp. UNC217MF]|uniref:hypothetical protein n=1 Tax=Paenibacillus sp. UNC217MF TaxID=1449062 RepID=UPI003FA76926